MSSALAFARKRPLLAAIGLVLLAASGAVAWWLGSPLFISQRVDEAFPMTRGATLPPGMSREQAEKRMAEAATQKAEVVEAMPPAAEPKRIAQGSFRDADSFHRGTGNAVIYLLPDGARVLRFEQFQVTNGPDLHVYLAGHPAPATRAEVEASGYVDLGKLKGNIGSQNYELLRDLDLGRFKAVVIYCQPFHVVFSTAMLE